jgi:hypothetical protein
LYQPRVHHHVLSSYMPLLEVLVSRLLVVVHYVDSATASETCCQIALELANARRKSIVSDVGIDLYDVGQVGQPDRHQG